MERPVHVRSFTSSGSEYHRAFATFLAHTDQKDKAYAWLGSEVDSLTNRGVLIDAGAGTGKLTAWLAPRFEHVNAIEPNPSLVAELRQTCPAAEIISTDIGDASPSEMADFILCSHVFYYISRPEWETTLRTMMGWLNPGGVLAIALQNPETDGMRMVAHFLGGRFDLDALRRAAQAEGDRFEAHLETVHAHIRAPDLQTACEIAEFVLNVLPMPSPPTWDDLERYVAERFRQSDGSYLLSCHQDFLRVTRRR